METHKEILIISTLDANFSEFKDIVDTLRPVAQKYNFILTNKKIQPTSFEDFKGYLESMLQSVQSKIDDKTKIKVDEPIKEIIPEPKLTEEEEKAIIAKVMQIKGGN